MDDIARHLGISKKTLYKYVSDKTDLVSKIFLNFTPPHQPDTKTLEKASNAIEYFYIIYQAILENLKDFNPHIFYDLKRYYPSIYEKLRERRQNAIITNIKTNIIQGQEEGLYRQDINPDIIAEIHYYKSEALITNNYLNSGKHSVKEIFTQLFKYHIYAIVNDKGREIVKQIKFFEQ